MRLREKTTATLLIAIFMISAMVLVIPTMAKKDYATIQDGTIQYGRVGDPDTEIIPIGYDRWGYNYQAHMFYGFYENNARPDPPVTESDTMLIMKWSDTWLSNKDRDGDRKLDRGYPYPTGTNEPPIYTSSAAPGAWLTNHQWGTYEVDGEVYHWTYFVKIVYPGDDAFLFEGVYYTEEDGTEIGLQIWGAYAVTQRVYNDEGTGEQGIQYLSPAPTGFGIYK